MKVKRFLVYLFICFPFC